MDDLQVMRLAYEDRDDAACKAEARVRELEERLHRMEDMIGYVSLHIKERWVVSKLTTVEKELWADSVEAFSRRLNEDDPNVEFTAYDRWWRE